MSEAEARAVFGSLYPDVVAGRARITHGQARGAACIIEAEQLCLLLGEDRRGDERVVTQAFTGCFRDSDPLRNEFLRATSQRELR